VGALTQFESSTHRRAVRRNRNAAESQRVLQLSFSNLKNSNVEWL
jgi:hypothetical protein